MFSAWEILGLHCRIRSTKENCFPSASGALEAGKERGVGIPFSKVRQGDKGRVSSPVADSISDTPPPIPKLWQLPQEHHNGSQCD